MPVAKHRLHQMRTDCLKMKIFQLNKFTVGRQERGFEISHLHSEGRPVAFF